MQQQDIQCLRQNQKTIEGPYVRKRSNNILHCNSSNETNLAVVLENATIIDTRPTSLTAKQTVPQYDKIHPLKKSLQLAACMLFRNKFLSKEFTNSTTKIIFQ